jgi:hypothetical protein
VFATYPGSQGSPGKANRAGYLLPEKVMNTTTAGEKDAPKQELVLRVRYAPIKAPQVEPHMLSSTTLADVKALALKNFGLVEGAVDGGTKTYQLSFDDIVQTNMSLMLGQLVTHGSQVDLLLIEQFVQG